MAYDFDTFFLIEIGPALQLDLNWLVVFVTKASESGPLYLPNKVGSSAS
jgi:hypothetical protein